MTKQDQAAWWLETLPSHPSPHCGRIDEHDPHWWRGVHGGHHCPGPPTGSTPYLKEDR